MRVGQLPLQSYPELAVSAKSYNSRAIHPHLVEGWVRFVSSKRVEILRDEGRGQSPEMGLNLDNLMFMQVQPLPPLVKE